MLSPAGVVALTVLALPIGVVLVVWVLVTGWRIAFPERPVPFVRTASEARRRRTARGEAVPVGFREIHEDLEDASPRVWLPDRDPRGRATHEDARQHLLRAHRN